LSKSLNRPHKLRWAELFLESHQGLNRWINLCCNATTAIRVFQTGEA
jgi:hypothetical protein